MTSDLRTRTRAVTRTTVSLVSGVLLLPGLLAACSASPDRGTAADGPSNSGAAALAACMRDRGYDMEDPGSGQISLSPPDGVDADQWRDDLVGCTEAGQEAGDVIPAQPKPGLADTARSVAECMRGAGYEDFPDDVEAQGSYVPSGDRAAFEREQAACSDQAAASTGQGE